MPEGNPYYETAQICENGHLITIHYDENSIERKDFCSLCGEKTIHECPTCHNKIQGCLHYIQNEFVDWLESSSHITATSVCSTDNAFYDIPAYCHHCGKAFPWTISLLEEANRIISMMDTLSSTQKEQLQKTFPDLITNTAHTTSSAIIAANILKQVEPFFLNALKTTISDKIVTTAISFLGW